VGGSNVVSSAERTKGVSISGKSNKTGTILKGGRELDISELFSELGALGFE